MAGRKSIFTKEELQIAERNGISIRTVKQRHVYGWSKEDCITRPVDKTKGNRNKVRI